MAAELERLNQVWTKAWLERDVSAVEGVMAPSCGTPGRKRTF